MEVDDDTRRHDELLELRGNDRAIAGLAIPAMGQASLADERRQGQKLTTQLQAGTKSCGDLSA